MSETIKRRTAGEGWYLFLLLGGFVLNGQVTTPLVPAMPAIADALGGGYDGQLLAQTIMALPQIMVVVGGILAAPLVAWFGKRTTLQIACTTYGIFGLAGAFAFDVPFLFASRMVVGIAAGMTSSVVTALIGDYYDSAGRIRMMGWTVSLSALASSAGLIAAGSLVDLFGWRGPFAIYGLSLTLLLAIRIVVPRRDAERVETREPQAAFPIRAVLPNWYLILFIFLTGAAAAVTSTQGPFRLRALHIDSAALQGLILSVAGFAAIGSSLLLFVWNRFLKPVPLLLTCLGGHAVCMVLFGLARHVPVLMAIDLFTGLFAGLITPIFRTLMIERTTPAGRTLAAGLLNGALFAGRACTPFYCNALVRQVDSHGVFIVTGMLIAFGAATALAVRMFRLRLVARLAAE
jgi:predicted MFS family arabinose efflux permease